MNLNELEDTYCEIRKTVDLQPANLEYLNASLEDDPSSAASYFSYNPSGGFLETTTYAWLSSKSSLTVFNTKTGANISTWQFKYRISCVSQFSSPPDQIPLLLVGLDNDGNRVRDSSGLICIFDPSTSQVLRAIRTPTGVEQLRIINNGSNYEESTDTRLETLLPSTSGLAFVALRNLDHLIIDLRRSSWQNLNSPRFDESNPAELDISEPGTRHRNRDRHAVHNLMSPRVQSYIGFAREEFESIALPQDSLTTVLLASQKISCLISGCLGRVIIWENDGVARWISPHLEESIFVSHLALLEPTDDPRPYCYLWVAYQDDSLIIPPVLRMYALLFERKYSFNGVNQYLNLEGEPSLKFEIELDEGTRLVNLSPIARGSNQEQTDSGNKHGEESLLLISTDGKAFLFDLNQWYKEQMPRSVIECQNVEAIITTYSMKNNAAENITVNCAYIPATLKEFSGSQVIPEEFFYPSSLSLEWSELGTMKVTTWLTRGVQAQLLREISIAGPVAMLHPSETFHRCISVGLIPFNGDASLNSDPDTQRDLLLTLCLEQRWTTFLLRCVKSWSDGSAAYLFPAFIRWAVQRASSIKLTAHRICIPLFDQSGSSIGEAQVKTLRSFSQQMECLTNVVENFSMENSSSDLEPQQRTLKRITIYLQVLLWFYDVGLLPESQEFDEESLSISNVQQIPYPVEKLKHLYQQKRAKCLEQNVKKSEQEEDLFIDELIGRECSSLIPQWEREGADVNFDGKYPPPSLQSLLRSCLIDCHQDDSNEMDNKHQIIIYVLMDLAMLLQGSCPSVDQLVKYPGAFKLSPSLIKLTQALWLLDHEDYHGFLEIMTGQLVCDSDVPDWQHKLIIRTLMRSSQSKLALIYLRVRKPPLSSLEDQGTVISLSVEHGLLQSAFHRRPPTHYSQLLTRFFKSCNANGKLNDILHLAMNHEEEEAFVQFLEREKCEETKLLYYLQRSRCNDAGSVSPNSLNQSRIPLKTNKSASLAVFNAYNDTLPAVTRKFTVNLAKKTIQVDPEAQIPQPLSHMKSRSRIQVLYEGIICKAKETFTRGDRIHVPFITDPSVSLRYNTVNSEANCVMFLEKAPKVYGKRSHDQMREEEPESSEPRKRRKTNENDGTRGDRLSLSMAFDTPHVKRKDQMKNTQVETPHSILKISKVHNIQDTLSPTTSPRPSPIEEEREKRPKQIRFSLNQPRFDESEQTNSELEQIDDSEQNENKTEQAKTELEQTGSAAEEGDTKSLDFSKDSETSELICSHHEQTTILSDNSHVTLPAPTPRTRPSLRATFADSPSDLQRKSLTQSMMNRDLYLDSSNLSLNNSIGSGVFCSTMLNPRSPRLMKSHCATTILSSGSSLDSDLVCPVEIPVKNNGAQVSTDSVDSFKHASNNSAEEIQRQDTNDSKHESECEEPDDVDLVKGIEERASEEQEKTYHSMTVEESKDVIFSLGLIGTKDAGKRKISTDDQNEILEQNDVYLEKFEVSEQSELQDDCDDELMALKYEDDDENDDDLFESIHNSIEVHTEETSAVVVQTSPSKSNVAKFYEDFNITDDESSKSVDESIFSSKNNVEKELLKTQELPDAVASRAELTNITDDESEPEEEKRFPQKSETDRNMNEMSLRTPKKAEIPVFQENLMPQRITRSRASSVASINEPPSTPEAPLTPKTRRASSLVPESSSPAKALPSDSATTPSTSSKRGRGRRATSLMKEVLTSSILEESMRFDVPLRRSTRRGASVQKELSGPSTKIDDVPEEISEKETPRKKGRAGSVAKELSGTPRKTKGHKNENTNQEETTQEAKPNRSRTGSVVIEIAKEANATPRKTRATSLVKDTEELSKTHVKPDKITSTSSESTQDVNESVSVTRKTRGSSVVKETKLELKEPVKKTRTRKLRTTSTSSETGEDNESIISRKARGTSVAKEIEKEPKESVKNTRSTRLRNPSVSSERGDEDESTKSRTTRETSVKKDEEKVIPKRTRRGSVAKETDNVMKAASVAKEGADEDDIPRRTRRGSVAREVDVSPNRGRAGLVAKELADETISKRTRAGSVTKDEDSDVPKMRATRATSVSKDEEEVVRSTRRRGSVSKELPTESLRKKQGGSIVRDVIPEENDDEEIHETRQTRNSSRVTEKVGESSGTRGHTHAIAEEQENQQGRKRRAMSVDQVEKKDSRKNDEEDAAAKKSRKLAVRRKRAVSETQKLEDVVLIERTRRGSKSSQKEEDQAIEYQFAAPEEARGEPSGRFMSADQVPEYVFAPPATRSATSNDRK